MKWININRRKPRIGQSVIAVGTWFGEITGRGSRGFIGSGEWNGIDVSIDSDTYSTNIIDVTHWMPLPALPDEYNG